MASAIAHRSSVGWATRCGDSFGFSQGLDEFSPRLVTSPAGLAITFDGRLDNSLELANALRLDGATGDDPTLVLEAYARWGEGSIERLLGDFAFAIWDPLSRELFCARDHSGVKPFYYAHDKDRFVFASEINGLIAAGIVPSEGNDSWIGDFLLGMVPPADQTIYSNIQRLPPAHFCVVGPDGVRTRRYWEPKLPAGTGRTGGADEFRSILQEAVRCRTRGQRPVASMLSGGLDSSAITCMAAPLVSAQAGVPMQAFSAVFEDPDTPDERPYIDSVLASCDVAPRFIPSDAIPPFGPYGSFVQQLRRLPTGANLASCKVLYEQAASSGARVLLDGHGGDETVWYGYSRLLELAHSGAWFTLWRELRSVRRLGRDYIDQDFWRLVRRSVPLAWARRPWSMLRGGESPPAPALTWALQFINPSFAEQHRLADRGAEPRLPREAAPRIDMIRHLGALTSDLESYVMEELDAVAAGAGIEPRYPFYDKRLIEFCLSLASSEKFADGWDRLVFRRAMQGVLPQDVQWRPHKFDFMDAYVKALLANHSAEVCELLEGDKVGLGAYMDLQALGAAFGRMASGAHGPFDVHGISCAIALSRWLESRSNSK